MNWEQFILSRLFLAAPELTADGGFLRLMMAEGLVTQDEINVYKKLARKARVLKSLRGKPLIQRLMIIMPEIMSVATVDLLRKAGLISVPEGHALRIALKAGKALFPIGPDPSLIVKRLAAMGDSLLSAETISLIRSLDQANIDEWAKVTRGTGKLTHAEALRLEEMMRISIDRAQTMKDVLVVGRGITTTVADAAKMDSIWSAVTVVGEGILTPEMLTRAARLGVISEYKYEIINALAQLGMNAWRKGIAASNQDNAMARALLVSEGVLSPEMIGALRAGGIISPGLASALYPAATIIRGITRGSLSQYMKSTKLHMRAGETPIQAFGRVTQMTDRGLLKLLAEAARDSRKEAELLAKSAKFGKMTKAAQQNIVERSLHLQMHSLYENVGHLTIFGEREAARAAASAMDFMQDAMWGKKNPEIRRMLRRQAESGLDSFISRSETIRPLSSRVYKNWQIINGRLSKDISKALLRGVNARDLAGLIANSIDPKAAGGVSYNAMRLARTEINNAFHQTSIRSTIDMPWVDGYKWNISGSHKHKDVCNDMANTNHDGIGRGIYKKGNVPGKPHPHCFCYVTTVNKGAGEFEAQLKRGSYDSYLKRLSKRSQGFGDSDYTNLVPMDNIGTKFLRKFAPMAAQMAGQAAAVGTLSLAARWLEEGGPKTRSIEPKPKPKGPKGPTVVEAYKETFNSGTYAQRGLNDVLGKDAVDFAFAGDNLTDLSHSQHDLNKIMASMEYRSSTYRPINGMARVVKGDLSLIEGQWDDFLEIQGRGSLSEYRSEVAASQLNRTSLDDLHESWSEMMGGIQSPAEKDIIWAKSEAYASKLGFDGPQSPAFAKYYEQMSVHISEAVANNHAWWRDPSAIYKALDDSMYPVQNDTTMYRISGTEWMNANTQMKNWQGKMESVIDHDHILNDMVGTRFIDDGYVSLESKPDYYSGHYGGGLSTAGRNARYIVYVPKGAPGMYGNASENEIVLGRGQSFEVLSVKNSTNDEFSFDVVIRMLPFKPSK